MNHPGNVRQTRRFHPHGPSGEGYEANPVKRMVIYLLAYYCRLSLRLFPRCIPAEKSYN